MKIFRSTLTLLALLLSLLVTQSISKAAGEEPQFDCNFRWNGIDTFLRVSQNGDTFVCLSRQDGNMQLSVRALSDKNSTTRNIIVPDGPAYVSDVSILDITPNGRYLVLSKNRFVSDEENPNEHISFARYFIADLKLGSIEEISGGFPKECSSSVGKFTANSQSFVFGVVSAAFSTDPERKKPPVFRGCDGKYVGYYSLNLAHKKLQKLGSEKMQPGSFIGDFKFNPNNSKVLHRGRTFERTLVSDVNSGESQLVEYGNNSDDPDPLNAYGYVGFIDNKTVLGMIQKTNKEDPSIGEGREGHYLVASTIGANEHKVLKRITVDASSEVQPFLSVMQSSDGRYLFYTSTENYYLKGLEDQGSYVLDLNSKETMKLFDTDDYFRVNFAPDKQGLILNDAEEMLYRSYDETKSYKYSIKDRKLKIVSGGRYLNHVHVVDDKLFFVTGTKFGDCGPTPGKTLYTIPLENGNPSRVSKKLRGTCGVFVVNVSEDKTKIVYASFQEPGEGIGVYEVDITSDDFTTRQLF